MFDFMRIGLPSAADAHGKKWICLHRVTQDEECDYYIAVEANEEGTQSLPAPQPCSLIAVPVAPAVAEARCKRAKP